MKAVLMQLLLASHLCLSLAELFTAISDMESVLVDTHKKAIDALGIYILREEERINNLKRSLNIYKKEHEVAMADRINYVGNPVTAFKLINQLTTDLILIEKGINSSAAYIKGISAMPSLRFPTEHDLLGAAEAVARVQETYNLNATELADWRHNGIGTPMSAGECYALGRALSHVNDYNNSLAWMKEALRKHELEGDIYITRINIMEFIAYTHYAMYEPETAVEWAKKILELDRNHTSAQKSLTLFQNTIADKNKINKNKLNFEGYKKLCRGELTVPQVVSKRLHCSYLRERHPFLQLAPIKQEQVYAKPDIYVFHEALSDEEMKRIQELAIPRFKRAMVVDVTSEKQYSNSSKLSSDRTGKSAFIDKNNYITRQILKRVELMTGLATYSAENLQVVDYGIGGHYGPHHDCAIGPNRHNAFEKGKGNRIATILFYMTTVARGGATVFPHLGLSVAPVKGSAVFWLNLNLSGEGDLAMQHASCPVLTGSKWVSTVWLHEAGNELIRPCGLEYQNEGISWKIPKPVPTYSRYMLQQIQK